jgi:hypothetical protein
MAITKSDVFAAADAIVAEGGNPSQIAVRKKLGSGSNTTISQYLAEWRVDQDSIRVNAVLRKAAPHELQGRLSEFGNEVWMLATELVETRLHAERQAIYKECDTALKDALNMNDQLQAELEAVKEALRDQTAKTVAAEEHAHMLGKALSNAMKDQGCDNDMFSAKAPDAELQVAQRKLVAAEAKIDLLQNLLNAHKSNFAQSSAEDLASRAALAVTEAKVKKIGDEDMGE